MDIALVKIFFLAAALEFLFHKWKAQISQFLQRNVGIHQTEKYLWPPSTACDNGETKKWPPATH